MENNKIINAPFKDKDEIILHLYTSQLLIESVASNIKLIESANEESRAELEDSVIDSLHVLIYDFSTVILSIQQGYLKQS